MTDSRTFHKQKPLTFRIIDSPMGIGKSATLIDLVRFHNRGFDPEPRRFIVFVPTIRERDGRYGPKLDLKSPATPPYNKSILELIRNGERPTPSGVFSTMKRCARLRKANTNM